MAAIRPATAPGASDALSPLQPAQHRPVATQSESGR